MVIDTISLSQKSNGTSRRSLVTIPAITIGNPYRPNDSVFGNLGSPEQGLYDSEQSRVCWILGTVVDIRPDYVLVRFSESQTRWLPVGDVMFARHFRNLEEESKGSPLDDPEMKIYVSDAIDQPTGRVPGSEVHNDVDTAVCFDTPRMGAWWGRVWPRRRAASR